MRLITLISILVLLTGCLATPIDTRSNYDYALDAIEREDYDAGYRLLESYLKEKKKPSVNRIKMKQDSLRLIKRTPELLLAAQKTFTEKSFQETVKRHNGNISNAMSEEKERLIIYQQLKKSKTIKSKQYKVASSNFKSFFNKRRKTKRNINYIAKGNLAVTKEISCIDINELTSSHTPADIFTGIHDCVNKDDPTKAVKLYAVALTYGHYDKLRMVDKTARGAISVLRFQLLSLINKDFKDKFNKEMKIHSSTNKDGKKFKNLCKGIQKLGKPDYYPKYMIRHGMAAFTGRASGVLSGFDEEEAWGKSIQGFLKC